MAMNWGMTEEEMKNQVEESNMIHDLKSEAIKETDPESEKVQEAVAGNENTSEETLDKLADSDSEKVQEIYEDNVKSSIKDAGTNIDAQVEIEGNVLLGMVNDLKDENGQISDEIIEEIKDVINENSSAFSSDIETSDVKASLDHSNAYNMFNDQLTESELDAKMNEVTENDHTVETTESLNVAQERELSNSGEQSQDNLDDLKDVAAEVAVEVVTS